MMWAGAAALLAVLAVPAETMDSCDAAVRERPEDRAAYACYYRVARTTGDFSGARARLDAHLREDPSNPWARMAVGNLDADRDSARAVDSYRAAIAELERRGKDDASILARLNLAVQVARSGDLEAAALELERADAVAVRAGASDARALVTLERARLIIRGGGPLGVAARMLDAAEEALLERGPYQARLHYFQARASIASQRGQLDAAIAFTDRGLEAARDQGDRYGAAVLAHNRLRYRIDAAPIQATVDVEALRTEADLVLAAAQDADHATAVTAALCLRGELVAAEADLRACMTRARAEDDVHQAALHAATLAAFLRDRERDAEADSLFAEARALARESHGPRSALLVDLSEAESSWRHLPLATARAQALAVVAAIEALTAEERAQEDRIPRFGGFTDVYRRFVGELLRHPAREAGDLALAFALGERMRAYSLRERIAAATPDPRDTAAPVDLAQARLSLGPGEALLVYQLGSDLDLHGAFAGGSWLWVISHAGVELVRLPARGQLAGRILGFIGSFAARDGSEEAAGAVLHRELVAPALARLGDDVHTLIVAPDLELHGLPFAALRPQPGAPPLLASHVVAVVPSVSAWARWRASEPRAGASRALGFADPPPLAAEDPGLPALPEARTELEAMAQALEGQAEVVLHHGDRATEAALRRELAGASLVHVAAHTRVDTGAPARSAVLLAASDTCDDARCDGPLTVPEIVELDAAGAWIVLAACSADSGPLVPGEGLDGLAQAWFRAGAAGVIATAWPIRDHEARIVFAGFYQALAEGAAAGPALAAAQRQALAAGLPAEAWAGVRVLGDPAARPLTLPPAPSTSRWWLVACAALLASLVGLVLMRRSLTAAKKR